MGCDIHAYVETLNWVDRYGGEQWSCGISNAGGRDYLMFGIMAGVRWSGVQEIPLRGLPEGAISWQVQDAAYLRVNDEHPDYDGCCSTEQAVRWGGGLIERTPGKFVTPHPDWHSRSWVTADELAQCLGRYLLESKDGPYAVEWDAILAYMRAYEERRAKARLVFWFDN